ncbi:hypothetical protein CVT24_012516 [Panaeolus cyanescens]|uniref:Uncharacterized protein n=1 Tax=Panaeolus cyanescens TaxID=181874 RepID=A0A409YK19_9AGAR|nr:hypothetical protein CVT24_012516 [Panaeolus cyanescens]
MRYSELQKLAHRLTVTASVFSPDKKLIHCIETKNSSLISKHWNGKSFINETIIVNDVRQHSSAAYVLSSGIETVVYIDTSSRLRVLDFNDGRNKWIENPHISNQYQVHPSGTVTACLNELGSVVVFFQKEEDILAHVTIDNPTSIQQIHLRSLIGSPLWAGFIRGSIYVFYISEPDHRLKFVKQKSVTSSWEVKSWSQQSFDRTPRSIIVAPNARSSRLRCEGYVLTADMVILHVAADGEWSRLGRIDSTGTFVSEQSVDMVCIESQNNTLTEQRLGLLFANDPSVIDQVGGPLSVTPLAAACWSGSIEAVHILLDNPYRLADPNAISTKGRTALYYAVSHCPPAHRYEIVRALLDAGADVDHCSQEDGDNTPLMIAVADTGDKKVIRELLERGASLTKTNLRGQTAWMLAAGTDFQKELQPRVLDQPDDAEGGHSVRKEVIDVLVAFWLLVMAYFNNQFVRDIERRVLIQLEANGVITGEDELAEDEGFEEGEPGETFVDAIESAPRAVSIVSDVASTGAQAGDADEGSVSRLSVVFEEGSARGSMICGEEVNGVAPAIRTQVPVSYVKSPRESRARVSLTPCAI